MNTTEKGTDTVIMIGKKEPRFARLSWLLRASARDDYRFFTGTVLVDSQYAVCTDGRRLHLLRSSLSGLNPGVYLIAKATTAEILLKRQPDTPDAVIPWPSYLRVVPRRTAYICNLDLDFKGKPFTTGSGDLAQALYKVYCYKILVDPKYIADLHGYAWRLYMTPLPKEKRHLFEGDYYPDKALIFRNRRLGMAAVIMPMRIKP